MKRYAVIVHEALKESGINFVAYLPDDQIHDAQKLITEDKDFTTVGVTNESEAVAACAGAWLGGAKPALLIADSGFLVATWPLASLSVSYGIPYADDHRPPRRSRRPSELALPTDSAGACIR